MLPQDAERLWDPFFSEYSSAQAASVCVALSLMQGAHCCPWPSRGQCPERYGVASASIDEVRRIILDGLAEGGRSFSTLQTGELGLFLSGELLCSGDLRGCLILPAVAAEDAKDTSVVHRKVGDEQGEGGLVATDETVCAGGRVGLPREPFCCVGLPREALLLLPPRVGLRDDDVKVWVPTLGLPRAAETDKTVAAVPRVGLVLSEAVRTPPLRVGLLC